jgi:hypothetical protein
MIRSLIVFFSIILLATSCYYDSEEYLYPQSFDCDTANVSFSASVKPIIDAYCVGCHSGGAPGGNLRLETFSNIQEVALNGLLVNSVFGTGGVSPMPKGGGSLSACELAKIKKWVDSGATNH